MTVDELTQTAFNIRRKWSSFGSIYRRFFDFDTNMGNIIKMALYWKYNPLFRKETFKKQGLRLGKY
jgi:hypothetical protein